MKSGTPSSVDRYDEFGRDFGRLAPSPPSPPHSREFLCLPRRRVAVKKGIKLPSFRVETFAAFYSSPSFPLIHSSGVLLFSKFHPRDPPYLFYPPDSRIGIEPLCRFALFSPSPYPLLLLLFSARSCFSRFTNVCKAPFTASYPSFLPLRTSNQRLAPVPN